MIPNAVAAFVGAFAALFVLAEVQMPSKWLRYLIAFVAGLLATVLLAMLVGWIVNTFQRV